MDEEPPRRTPPGRPDSREKPVPLKRGGRPLPPRAPNTQPVDVPKPGSRKPPSGGPEGPGGLTGALARFFGGEPARPAPAPTPPARRLRVTGDGIDDEVSVGPRTGGGGNGGGADRRRAERRAAEAGSHDGQERRSPEQPDRRGTGAQRRRRVTGAEPGGTSSDRAGGDPRRPDPGRAGDPADDRGSTRPGAGRPAGRAGGGPPGAAGPAETRAAGRSGEDRAASGPSEAGRGGARRPTNDGGTERGGGRSSAAGSGGTGGDDGAERGDAGGGRGAGRGDDGAERGDAGGGRGAGRGDNAGGGRGAGRGDNAGGGRGAGRGDNAGGGRGAGRGDNAGGGRGAGRGDDAGGGGRGAGRGDDADGARRGGAAGEGGQRDSDAGGGDAGGGGGFVARPRSRPAGSGAPRAERESARRPPASAPSGTVHGGTVRSAGDAERSAAMYRRRRLVPIIVVAVVLLLGVIVVKTIGGGGPDKQVSVAEEYVEAFSRGDYPGMYDRLTAQAQSQIGLSGFIAAHRKAMATATGQAVVVGGAAKQGEGRVVGVPVSVRTRLFGTITGSLQLPVDGNKIAWRPNLVFPGLRVGEQLTTDLRLPQRATILARDGSVLAAGETRTPGAGLSDVASETVGTVGPAPDDRKAELKAAGLPTDATVGLTGLERALDAELRGTPGGTLRAGPRQLASRRPRQSPAVRTTISPPVVRAAAAALASSGKQGGIVALEPRTGAVLGFSGIAFSSLQPPGSTFKIITLTAALEAGTTTPETEYPVETAATLEGVQLDNANGESCGGTLARSFALSCNSVFAPLGADLGAEKLVATAEKFGFNGPPLLPGAAQAVIPQASEIGDDLAVGSSAIGQGKVQATALQMATVAATIADRGRKPTLTLLLSEARKASMRDAKQVIPASVAQTVGRLMEGVVKDGTGVKAAIDGVDVAGKTGTAELKSTTDCTAPPPTDPTQAPVDPESCVAGDESDTDAWFAAFAPGGGRAPKVAVGVLVVQAGAGGDTAAPLARQVLIAALQKSSGATGATGTTG